MKEINYIARRLDNGEDVYGDLIQEDDGELQRAFIFRRPRKDGWLLEYDNFGYAQLYTVQLVEVDPASVRLFKSREDEALDSVKVLEGVLEDIRKWWTQIPMETDNGPSDGTG